MSKAGIKRLLLRSRNSEEPPGVSRRTALRVTLLLGPTILLVGLVRLIEHALLKAVGMPSVGDVLESQAMLPAAVLLATVASGLAMRSVWPRLRTGWWLAATLLLGAGLTIAAALVAPLWATGWLTLTAFQVIREDVLVLLVLGLLFTFLLERLGGWKRACCLTTLHVLVLVLLLFPLFELGAILAVGAAPDGMLLRYTARHLDELAPVLTSEAGPLQMTLLALPFLITLLPLGFERLSAVQRWMEALPSNAAPARVGPIMGTMLPLFLVFLLPPSAPLPSTHQTISYTGLVRSLFENRMLAPEDLDPLAVVQDAPFETDSLRLVPTDRIRRMNVVVILLESFRRRSVTPYAPSLATTPFLDSLAQQGLLVEHMYAIVPYTNKALTPILAGIYPELSLEVVEAEPGGVPGLGLPALLKPAGYRSAFFTPAELAFERKDLILENLGFDEKYGGGSYPTEGFYATNYFGYEDRIVLEPSLAWVDDVVQTGQPFFLAYLTLTAHHPYTTPPAFERRPFAPHDERLNEYLNALHYTDGFLADLFRGFEERGLLDETLFVLAGDHGQAFGEHGLNYHGDVLWDEALEVPALLYNPVLFPEGGLISGNRHHVDFLPTIADVLGYRLEGGSFPGSSLLRAVPAGRPMYHSVRSGILPLALRQDSLKFIYYNRRQPMQVFDLHADPFERHDIADRIAPDRLRAAELSLILWRHGVQEVYHQRPSHARPYAAR